ncbi:MAG: hypothetical protein FJW56_09420 [Actinobacteria bacterium]|nr:hypothetical protein [Actinomycetota bacterium]
MSFTGILLAGGRSSRFKFNKLKIEINSVPLFIDQIFKLSFFCREILICASRNNSSIISDYLTEIDKYFDYIKEFFNRLFIKNGNLKDIFFNNFRVPEIKIIEDDYKNFNRIISGSAGNINNINDISNGNYSLEYNSGLSGSAVSSPLLGIYSGLKKASHSYSIILAFDMPFVSYRLLKMLADCAGIIKNYSTNNSNKKNFKFKKAEKEKDICIVKTNKGFEALCGLYSKNCIDTIRENIKKGDHKISNIFSTLTVEVMKENKLKLKNIDNLNFFNINRTGDYKQFIEIWESKVTDVEKSENREKTLKSVKNLKRNFFEKWMSFYFR